MGKILKTLNLANADASDIEYRIINFPDGQNDIVLTFFGPISDCPEKTTVKIISRFKSFIDFELISCAVAALRNINVKEITLYIPYILGARSDRRFVDGGVSYLRQVIGPPINQLHLSSISSLDVHNQAVSEAIINNLVCVSNSVLTKWVFGHINSENMVIVCPDDGASKKIYPLCSNIGYKGDVVICSKHRNTATGAIESVVVSNPELLAGKDVVIIDDICDGGRTFTEIAKVVKPHNPATLNLQVTHGIFSQGLKELSLYFDRIFTTNSYREINLSTEFGSANEPYIHKVHQLKVI